MMLLKCGKIVLMKKIGWKRGKPGEPQPFKDKSIQARNLKTVS